MRHPAGNTFYVIWIIDLQTLCPLVAISVRCLCARADVRRRFLLSGLLGCKRGVRVADDLLPLVFGLLDVGFQIGHSATIWTKEDWVGGAVE